MNIKAAVERVSKLRDHEEEMMNIRTMLEHREAGDEDVHVDVWNPLKSRSGHEHQRRAMLPRNLLIEALTKSIEAHRKEIAHLQPIIDMANAALKGIGA